MYYQRNTSTFVCRDVQMLIGQKVVEQCHFVNDNFFKIFCCPRFYRISALSSLSRLAILTLNNGQVQLRSTNGKEAIIVDLSKNIGYLYLQRLVNLVVKFTGFWIKEIHLVSLKFVEFDKLMGILHNHKGVKVLSLPYEFANRRSKKMEILIQNNANTLVALKHLTFPLGLPREMRERLTAIHTSTLRNGTLKREQDFYAFYASGALHPSVLEPLPNSGVLLRIELHRLNEPLRAAKRAFVSYGTMNLLSQIVVLKFTSIILSVLDNASVQKLLNELAKAQQVFPNLTILEFELKLLDAYPNNYSLIMDIEERENDIVSPMALDSIRLSELLISWINSHTFPFNVFAKVCLSVDYVIGENEDKNEMLEKAIKETSLSLNGTRWAQIKWKCDGSSCLASEQIEINEQTKFEYLLDYRSSIYSEKSFDENILFNIGHSL